MSETTETTMCAACGERPADEDVTMTVTEPSTGRSVAVPLCMPCAEAYMRGTVGQPGTALTLEYGDDEEGEDDA